MLPKVIRQGDFLPFAEALFDREEQALKAAPILKAILDAVHRPEPAQSDGFSWTPLLADQEVEFYRHQVNTA